jgi:hypothetical protein
MGGEMGAQHQPEGVRKQEVAILAPFALVHENLAGGEVHIADRNPHEFSDPHRCEKQQLQHNFMLHVPAITYRTKTPG